MSKKNINFRVPLVVYPFDVMVSIDQDDYQLGPFLDKLDLSVEEILMCRYSSERSPGRFCMFSNGVSFIRIRRLPKSSEDFGTLAHEIFHVCAAVMDRIGTKLQVMVSDEPYAYLIGYLTEHIYKKMNKYYD